MHCWMPYIWRKKQHNKWNCCVCTGFLWYNKVVTWFCRRQLIKSAKIIGPVEIQSMWFFFLFFLVKCGIENNNDSSLFTIAETFVELKSTKLEFVWKNLNRNFVFFSTRIQKCVMELLSSLDILIQIIQLMVLWKLLLFLIKQANAHLFDCFFFLSVCLLVN